MYINYVYVVIFLNEIIIIIIMKTRVSFLQVIQLLKV